MQPLNHKLHTSTSRSARASARTSNCAAAGYAQIRLQLQARRRPGQAIRFPQHSPIRSHAATESPGEAQADVLAKLSREIHGLESGGSLQQRHAEATSTGCELLDGMLPQGGYMPGSVIEYLRSTPGCGASYLALAAARAALSRDGCDRYLVIVDPLNQFYPPAIAACGLPIERTIFVRPQSQADTLWAIDQAVRTQAVGAVVAELARIDDRSARRMQLAAEQGGGLALLLRSSAARHQPSWAEVQWLIRALPSHSPSQLSPKPQQERPLVRPESKRRVQLRLVRVRGGKPGRIANVSIDGVTGNLQAVWAGGHERKHHEQSGAASVAKHNRTTAVSTSAVRLAAELAGAANPGRRAEAG